MAAQKQRPVILQVIPQLETGGAELSTLEMVDALSKSGARALVVSQGGRMAAQVERFGGENIIMPVASKNPFQINKNRRELQRLIRQHDIALVHARSRAPAWSCLLAAKQTAIPLVTTYHGAYGGVNLIKRTYNSVMARGKLVIANSRFTADMIQSRHQTDERRMRIIYRGVDLQRFSQSAISEEQLMQLRTKWGVEKDAPLILHPARLTRWKGQGVVIRAMAKLIEAGEDQNAVVILAGDPQGREAYVSELKELIVSLALEDRVRLVGHCSDMAVAYGLAKVTLIASIEPEAFGRTSAEAQAMGCPVIATNIGAPPETVRAKPHRDDDQLTGWLVAPQNPDKLARALGEVLMLAPDSYEKLSLNARKNVEENFSDELMKVKTLAVYDELLGTRLAEKFREKTAAGVVKPIIGEV
ncbi:MAG: glycosyltransferase family 4 protein [Hyphomicrobiaceae bacterium]|nr:glycosyltransferase family 4 protein [Hyphomicrobiaceae bacterium]